MSATVENRTDAQEATTTQHSTEAEIALNAFIDTNKARLIETGYRLLEALYTRAVTLNRVPDRTPYQELYEQLEIESQRLYESFALEALRTSQEPQGFMANISWWLSTAPIKEANRALRGNSVHAQSRRNYLTAIVCIMWALNQEAENQSKVIERGSFKIKDPDGKLFEFLYGYAQFATGQESPTIVSNDFAYKRDPKLACSSHYKNDRDQFGIDIRFQGGDYALALLPHQHTHILFGKIEVQEEYYTFVKFEEAGLGNFYEFLKHSLNFAKSSNVDVNTTFREKDVPAALKQHYVGFCSLNGIEPINKPAIHQMWEHMSDTVLQSPQANTEKKDAFEEEARKLALDNVAIRTGQEVILDMNQLPHNRQPLPNAVDISFPCPPIDERVDSEHLGEQPVLLAQQAERTVSPVHTDAPVDSEPRDAQHESTVHIAERAASPVQQAERTVSPVHTDAPVDSEHRDEPPVSLVQQTERPASLVHTDAPIDSERRDAQHESTVHIAERAAPPVDTEETVPVHTDASLDSEQTDAKPVSEQTDQRTASPVHTEETVPVHTDAPVDSEHRDAQPESPVGQATKNTYRKFWLGLISVASLFLVPVFRLGLDVYQSRIASQNTTEKPKNWAYWAKAITFSLGFTVLSVLTAFILPLATLYWLKKNPQKKQPPSPTVDKDNHSSTLPKEAQDATARYPSDLCHAFDGQRSDDAEPHKNAPSKNDVAQPKLASCPS